MLADCFPDSSQLSLASAGVMLRRAVPNACFVGRCRPARLVLRIDDRPSFRTDVRPSASLQPAQGNSDPEEQDSRSKNELQLDNLLSDLFARRLSGELPDEEIEEEEEFEEGEWTWWRSDDGSGAEATSSYPASGSPLIFSASDTAEASSSKPTSSLPAGQKTHAASRAVTMPSEPTSSLTAGETNHASSPAASAAGEAAASHSPSSSESDSRGGSGGVAGRAEQPWAEAASRQPQARARPGRQLDERALRSALKAAEAPTPSSALPPPMSAPSQPPMQAAVPHGMVAGPEEIAPPKRKRGRPAKARPPTES